MTCASELRDELLNSYENKKGLWGEEGILKQLTKALVERWLEGEMKTHLEEQRTQNDSQKAKNRRNGHSKKTIKREFGEAEIGVLRERESEFESIIVKKGQTRVNGFD